MTVFRVGMKVVCVDAARRIKNSISPCDAGLKAGSTYTVRWSGISFMTGNPAVRLMEIKRPRLLQYLFRELPIDARRFRTILTKSQNEDVQLIKSYLTDDPVLRLDLLLEDMDVEGAAMRLDLP